MGAMIERKLWCRELDEITMLTQGDVHAIQGPIIVLGEAGMGKTTLLEWMASQPGYAFCTARQLINRPRPQTLLGNGTTLVIDALDEVTTKQDGDAVDLVLRKLGELDYPRFVLSCRVADWQSAVSTASISEQYDLPLQELHIEPLSEADALDFLSSRLGECRAREVCEHFNRYGLNGFLGNPQTLEMIERVAPSGELPKTSSDLFDRAIEIIRGEHRDEKAASQLQRDVALNAAGAAFAALLLTGSEAISRRAIANLSEGELALVDVEAFDSGNVGAVLGTRLFRALGPDRFSYWHRRIGEYLGARWLASRADTRGKRRRLLALLTREGLVRANFRGIFAWLAIDPDIGAEITAIDPMAVIDYGDADVLDAEAARAMLKALHRVSLENPRFRGAGPYRAKALVQPALLAEVRAAISDRAVPFGLRLLLLQQIQGTRAATVLRSELRAVLLDPGLSLNERATAGEALAGLPDISDWPEILEKLRVQADSVSTRVGIELLSKAGFKHFDDRLICELILGYLGITASSIGRRNREPIVGVFYGLGRSFPIKRMGGVLDLLVAYLAELTVKKRKIPENLVELMIGWIAALLASGNATATAVWRWLDVIRPGNGYNRRAWDVLAEALRADATLRRGVLKIALLDKPQGRNIWAAAVKLRHLSPALVPDEGDVVTLLGLLDPDDRTDQRWREILLLTGHNGQKGAMARKAAKAFVSHRQDMLAWIDRLAIPRLSRDEMRQPRRELRQRGKKALGWASNRREFSHHTAEMLAGEPTWLVAPANCYLGIFSDINNQLPGPQRLEEWLGQQVAATAKRGFEANLAKSPPEPSARQIAWSIAESRYWQEGRILVAAFAERRGQGISFQDLPAERLIAGWLELRHRYEGAAKGTPLRDAVAAELKRRKKWRSAQVLLLEPQFRKRRTFVEGLYELMNARAEEALAVDLALGWLNRWSDIPHDPERDLVGRVIHSVWSHELSAIAASRLAMTNLDMARRQSWLAVQIITDFDQAILSFNSRPVKKELLWDLREYMKAGRPNGSRSASGMGVRELSWIVSTFRGLWPYAPHPRSSQGEKNPWDATEFLNWVTRRIGEITSDDAIEAMDALRATQDGYLDAILEVSSQQRRLRIEALVKPPELRSITDLLTEGPPATAADLQAVVLEALDVAQARLKGDPLDWYKGFYTESGVHKDEEACRDELMKLLDGKIHAVEMRPESHLADDKRVDIECSAAEQIMVPVEIKGQWHKALWTAADDQLDKLYSSDWRVERRGIYLVLWFGDGVPLTKDPSGKAPPETSEELRDRLVSCSKACSDGAVAVVVLDLTRP